jgi:hypothetical protein
MGNPINIIPTPTVSGAIKSIQRGEAIVAGSITISSVDISKTTVNFYSTTSSGTASVQGTLSGMSGAIAIADASVQNSINVSGYTAGASAVATNTGGSNAYLVLSGGSITGTNMSTNAQTFSGGSTNLIMQNNGAYLSNSTTLVATGPCRYEVIEYY